MAGMLPGVEAARRRRVHQSSGPGITATLGGSGGPSPSSRRCSFSLFSTNSSTSSLVQQRSRTYQGDEKLGQLARKAKQRLDERLRLTRNNSNSPDLSEERVNDNERGSVVTTTTTTRRSTSVRELRTEVYGGSKKMMMKRWANKIGVVGWKAGEQQECAVCLDEFKVGDHLVNMPCAHRFHSTCLIPWLQTNAHCPCCRTSLNEQLSSSSST